MARKFLRSWLVVLLLLSFGQAVSVAAIRRAPHRLAVEQIEQLEELWRQAQLASDVPAMDRLLSEDFLGITATGSVVTKAQQLDRMRSRKFVIKEFNVADSKIKLIGAIAIVTSLAIVDGVVDGEAMHGSYRYTRVYQRIPNGPWRITSFEATRVPRASNFAATSDRGFGPQGR